MVPELPRWQKILLAMYWLSKGTTENLKYEDIVVELFKKFPETFHLRGYPQYPDSGDLIHKPLYSTLKPKGLVTSGNKMFALTSFGISIAEKIANLGVIAPGKKIKVGQEKPPR